MRKFTLSNGVNLPEFLSFRKEPGQTILICLVIILVGLSAFALGRVSASQTKPASSQAGLRLVGEDVAGATSTTEGGGSVETPGTSVAGVAGAVAGGVVASKSGTKYHFPWCAGAKAIKDANKIWFTSTAEAKAAGYQPASNCKGLE